MNELIGYFSYDPETGNITRLASTRKNHVVGERVGYVCAKHGYRRFKFQGKRYLEHRVAWYLANGKDVMVDHINGDRADNRLANLREATHAENMQNKCRYKNNKAGMTGVSATRYGKWTARITKGGKTLHLGNFDTKEQAFEAYKTMKARVHDYQPTSRE